MSTLKTTILLSISVFVFVSCTTPVSTLSYLENLENNETMVAQTEIPEYQIGQNDNLYIRVIGEDELLTAFLNITNSRGGANFGNGTSTLDFVTYVVDADGFISMPQIGRVKVEGLTIREVEDKLTPKVNELIENTSVIVRVVNRKVSVLGEVHSPGQHQMVKYNQTIFETLAMAGDLTDYGNRKNIKLIRETKEGKIVAKLNLNDASLLMSPYYYILPDDVIYVEPRDKLYGTKTLPYTGPVIPILSVISSALAIGLFFIKK